ncbi:MAG: SUMF1/EgtB/PvdO family nonheme iron enzyme [Candidatus Electrothrix sp. GW3-4]|uniref:formylglycine-generating enzyme family protein n=1 Tax=Candidatus Electrothrix sp. GW3-4 TaxID=3126740 RepID=UPI0030D46A2F
MHIHLANKEEKVKPRLSFEPELVEIPTSPFLMGSKPAPNIPAHETPQHLIELAYFFACRTPITNRQYQVFVHMTGHEAPKGWILRKPPTGFEEHPVTGVSCRDAVAFCLWLSKQSGRPYRLPTEAEWEKAARSTDGRLYPWGNAWLEGRCNCDSDQTTLVTAFSEGASQYGCLDMLGNVREWTSTIWGTDPGQTDFPYPFALDERNALHFGSDSVYRIHRGGCFRDQQQQLRCAARGFSAENSKLAWCGFRVVLER